MNLPARNLENNLVTEEHVRQAFSTAPTTNSPHMGRSTVLIHSFAQKLIDLAQLSVENPSLIEQAIVDAQTTYQIDAENSDSEEELDSLTSYICTEINTVLE